MRTIALIIMFFSIASVSANEELVNWTPLNSKINEAKVEVSRYDADGVDWPIIYMWARITFPMPDEDGDHGEIQEWWMNCSKIKGETITYRTYKNKDMEIGKWSQLGHFQEKINTKIISEVCELYEPKKST